MKKKQSKQNKPVSSKYISPLIKLPAINNKKPTSNPTQSVNLNISSYQDQGLITLIQQYLLKNNLFDTLQIFHKDCIKGFKPSIKSFDILKKQLLDTFDSGNRELFFYKFAQYVPLSMRAKDIKTLKMQFYIHLYFFIFQIHPFLGKKKTIELTAKQSFIAYLEGQGSKLSKQQQFLPLFALAYLQKPQQNQTFKSMFTKQWIQDLRKQVINYIQKLYPSTKIPTIVSIYDKFIELNLEADKFSSVDLTQPDEDQDQNQIQQIIQQNFQQSVNPQPVLLQNNNGLNKVMKSSLEKYQSLNQHSTISKGNNSESPRVTIQKEQIMALSQRVNQLEEQRAGLLSYIQNYKKKYQNLQNDFKQFSQSIKAILQQSQNKWFKIIQELYNVALDLLNAANNLEKGIPLSDPSILVKRGQKLQRYKGFVSMNIEDLLSDNVADYSLFEKPEHDLSVDMVKKNTEYFEKEQKFIEIDFNKLKAILATVPTQDMLEEDAKQLSIQKYLILQALRQRLTKMRGASQKREVVLSYTMYDVLSIKETKQKESNILIDTLLNNKNQSLMLQTTLLISALCKDYYGRQYLFDQKLMIKMMQIRRKSEVNDKIKQIILIIFQLQSNKRSCQTIMIENGLMEEIVQKLDKQRDQMNAFDMEYATALLLNLLLSKQGLDRAQRIKSEILMALINLMQTQNSQVKNFVHASLYPLLARKTFREKALEFGMQTNIKYLLENNPSAEFQHQLKYVYNRLMMEKDEEQEKEDQPDYDQINDEEIGEDIPFINDQINSALSGQFFLMKKYALTGPDAMQQMVQIKEEVRITFSKAIYYDRQTTERYSVQTPLLGKGRKSQIQLQKAGFTISNSVYSNRSSNRVHRSEKNSRIKNSVQNKTSQKQKAEAVQQNESEKPFQPNQNSKGEQRSQKLQNLPIKNEELQKQKVNQYKNGVATQSIEESLKQIKKEDKQRTGSLIKDFDSIPISVNQKAKIAEDEPKTDKELKDSVVQKNNQENYGEKSLRTNKLKPYEQSEQYIQAFQTRSNTVRTPPQKQN